jgi:hypothetical protein
MQAHGVLLAPTHTGSPGPNVLSCCSSGFLPQLVHVA